MADRLPHLGRRHIAFVVRSGRDRRQCFGVLWPRRLRHEVVSDADPDISSGRAGAAGERARHPGQELLVRVRVPQPFGELREHLIRRCALAIDQPVGESPRTASGRLECECDDRRRGGGQDRIRATPHDRSDADHHGDVDDGDEHRERSDEERTFDHDIDVEQVVPQHRHADRDRDQAEREDRDALEDVHPAGLVVDPPRTCEPDQQGERVQDRHDRRRRHQPSQLEPLDP